MTLIDRSTCSKICASTQAFTAALEVDEGRANEPWQVSLWHSENAAWREVSMERIDRTAPQPTTLQVCKSYSNLHKIYFRTALPTQLPMHFTVKFRNGTDQSWKWVKDHQGAEDGLIMLKTVTSQNATSRSLKDYVEDLNPILKVGSHLSQSPGTTVWSVDLPIEAAEGEKPAIKDVKFGAPWGYQKVARYVGFWFSKPSLDRTA